MPAEETLTTNLPDLDDIYKNLLTAFHPAAKRLVQAGRDLLKAWLAVSDATRAYAEALDRLGAAGSNCGGETKEIGHCLSQIADAVKDLNKHERNTVSFYETDVLVLTEGNLDQDSKVIIEQRKTFEKKQKQMIERLKRDKKKGVPVDETMRMLQDYQSDCVKQALTEEKKRYTYMLDRHCALVSKHLQLHRTAVALYEQRIHKWKEACANPEELSAAALAALDAAIQPYSTQSSLTLSTISRPTMKSMLSNTRTADKDAVSASRDKVAAGTLGLNGSGQSTQNVNTITTVLLHGPQYATTDSNHPKGSPYTPPPSTTTTGSSSTSSNGSRRGTTPNGGDQPPPAKMDPLTSGKRVPSVSSLIINSGGGGPTTTTNCRGDTLSGSEYAVGMAAGKSATMTTFKADAAATPFPRGVGDSQSPLLGEHRRRVLALFTYNNAGTNQLSFQEGDAILIIQDGQQGWQYGENLSSGKRGWYPASFTKPCGDEEGDFDQQLQHRPRSHSSSMLCPIDSRTNGNCVKYSPTDTSKSSDARTSDSTVFKSNPPRPVSMMVFQSSADKVTTPTGHYRQTPRHVPSNEEPSEDEVEASENNIQTSSKRNPFSHVKLRHVVKTDGAPKKYG